MTSTSPPAAEDDPLRQAARTFAARRAEQEKARQEVAEARRKLAVANKELESARAPLREGIIEAARSGVRQREIHSRIEDVYTRERIRTLCVEAGISLRE